MKKLILYFFILIIIFACTNQKKDSSILTLQFKEIPTPSQEGGEPNLFVSETGQTYLSWVEYLNDTTDALLFSILEENKWSKPKTISSGSDWFVNWADFPSLVAYKDNGQSLAAHWLQKSAAGTYDYDVRIVQSFDSGETWGTSFIPHRDSIAAEHGFVSMLPLSEDKIFATWLDGRNTKANLEEKSGHGHHGHGAMTLRTAEFDKNGNLTEEAELDNRICDCCQTSAAMTAEGPIIAYRDRSEDEIRDISIVRKVNGLWTTPRPIYADNWEIAGCPVNGPSIAAIGNSVAIVWYSMADGEAQIKVAFSKNGGESFFAPIRIDERNPIGRVDLDLLSPNLALVSWIGTIEDTAKINLVQVKSNGEKSDIISIADISTSRQSGFPILAKNEDQIILSWTQVDSISRVRTMVSNLD